VLELLFVPEGDGARLYVAGWCPVAVRERLDAVRSARLPAFPNLADLERFMWNVDAPYRLRAMGPNLELEARGRGAVVLGEWVNSCTTDRGRQEAEARAARLSLHHAKHTPER
jgi:hypothetical protein